MPIFGAKGVTASRTLRHGSVALACVTIALSAAAVVIEPTSGADPSGDNDLFKPLPVVVPTPTNWAPKFPFPYDQTRGSVTETDITAERELCQWYNADYDILTHQIDRLQFHRITPNPGADILGSGTDYDYSHDDIQQQADIVIANIDRAEDFLAPRVQALTQSRDYMGDVYFPIYQGASFWWLWQILSNVGDGIKSHQADWFTGPSVQRVRHWGSQINRSHVCR
jgi:hypothetical protein